MKRRILASILALIMVCAILPMTAKAVGSISGAGGGNLPQDPDKDDEITEFKPLEEEISHQSVPYGTPVEALELPGRLPVIFEGYNENAVDPPSVYNVEWSYEEYDPEAPGEYIFTAILDRENFTFADNIVAPAITITVQERVLPKEYSVGSWEDLETAINATESAEKIITITSADSLTADRYITVPAGVKVQLKVDESIETPLKVEITSTSGLFSVKGTLEMSDLLFQGQETEGLSSSLISVSGVLKMDGVTIQDYGAVVEKGTIPSGGAVISGADNCKIELTGCTIQNNVSIKGTVVCSKGTLQIQNCEILDNITENSSNGGGGVVASDAEIMITGSTIRGNGIRDTTYNRIVYGGGIKLSSCTGTIEETEITGNHAMSGAGLFAEDSAITVQGCTISDNDGTRGDKDNITWYQGGGIYLDSSELTITDTEIANNASKYQGGGIYIERGSELSLDGTVSITKNQAVSGGGIFVNGAEVTLCGAAVKENKAIPNSTYAAKADNGNGGGIYVEAGELILSSGEITGNTAGQGEGGGVFVNTGTFTMSGGEITGNTAQIAGGVENAGIFTMSGGTVTENHAEGIKNSKTGIGGGVANTGTFTMKDTAEIYENTADMAANDFYNGQAQSDGGGINVGIDDSWDGKHDMELDSLTVSAPASRSGYGTFTLRPADEFGYIGWFEDKLDNRYSKDNPTSKYTIIQNDATLQYLTLGLPESYGVLYGFEAGTKGHGLTDEITALLPIDGHQYKMGDTVTAIQPAKTVIDDPDKGGVYVFEGYKEGASQVVSADTLKPGADDSDPKTYIHFNGVWKWYAKHTVTYEYEGTVPAGAPQPPEAETAWENKEVTVAAAPVLDGYIFSGWEVDSPSDLSIQNGKFTMPKSDVRLVGSWEKAQTVSIQPADVTIYMGGEGYDGVVNEAGEASTAERNGFPEPGFIVKLPQGLAMKHDENGTVTNMKLQYTNEEVTYTWGLEKYGAGNHSIYRIVPTGETEKTPIRMTFTPKNGGDPVNSDEFDFDSALYQTLIMEVYGEGIEAGKVKAVYTDIIGATTEYDVTTGTGTLTVRGASDAPDKEQYGTVAEKADEIESGSAGVVAGADVTYTINGSPVEVDDSHTIALLFDAILEENNADTSNTDLLTGKAEEVLQELGDSSLAGKENLEFQARYLDLVDRSNGNAWVATDKAITVYWPLPAGATKDTKFELLHFEGLHREMGTNTISEEIKACRVTPVTITVTDTHIVFEVQPYRVDGSGNVTGGFSPFVLVYEGDGTTNPDPGTPDPVPVVPTPPDSDDDDDDDDRRPALRPEEESPVPDALNGDDHYAYVIGFADGSVRPYAYITRAQVATIFFRLLTEETRQAYLTSTNPYPDVDEDYWANTAISTMTALGVIKGRSSGLFDPDASITRAEFAAICARFDTTGTTGTDSRLTDIAGHWAEAEIKRAEALGWVQGFTDNTFRPQENITRAQAVTMINRVLRRMPETAEDLLPGMNTWTDCGESDWYYLAVQEATNSHDFRRKDDVYETWTSMNEDPDWKQYE